MSDVLSSLVSRGAHILHEAAHRQLEAAVAQKGIQAAISFPQTAYYFPFINALLAMEVKTLADCRAALAEAQKMMDGAAASPGVTITKQGGMLNKGLAALIAEEILAGLSVFSGAHPQPGCSGFIPDTIMRSLGLQLVDGRIAGIAVILGACRDDDSAAGLIRDFQAKSIVSLLAGTIAGVSMKAQLERAGMQLGLENYVVPLGADYISAIYAVNFAVRAPLMYGGYKPGQRQGIIEYMRNRVPAFVLALGGVDEVAAAAGVGAIALGLPVITDMDIPLPAGIDTTLPAALATEKDYKKIPSRCILARGIKVKLAQADVPVPYAASFEGERVRREQMQIEFGGKAGPACELLCGKNESEVEDGAVKIIGPDIQGLSPEITSLPLAILVDVSGRGMQKDFEPILERQIHRFVNYAMGVMHMGQRDMVWIRISKDAFARGFRLRHIGVIIGAMLHQEYGAIVDKAQVTLVTDEKEAQRLSTAARRAYAERDERISGMTDESVDTYYSCLLCQSFAPNHVCVITPERPGLCGAYSWLDARASFEIASTGPNRPIMKGVVLDARRGQWENVNEFVKQASNKAVERVSMYSLMDSPQTSCGCFECIIAVIPEVNGVMAVHRDYTGMTPCGMNFTTLAGSVGGGVQTPGFTGVGKLYLASAKFIAAEGGLRRLVWVPKELKDSLADKLARRAQEIGAGDLMDKIADETAAVTLEQLRAFLAEVRHPALEMESLI